MKLKKINCRNFFNHIDTTLDFTEVGSPVLLMGANGSGKSSATSESLTYALFGETRLSSIDDAIRLGEDEMLVVVDFELNGQEIRIARSKKRGKTQKLRLFIDDEDASELLSETQKHVSQLIPLSSNAFKSSVILRQEDADWFLQQKPDERKKVIAEILDLGLYERLEKLAKEQRAEMKITIKAEQNVLDSLPEENIQELRGNLDKVERYLGNFTEKIELAQLHFDKINAFNVSLNREKALQEEAINNNEKITRLIAKIDNEISTKRAELESFKDVVTPVDTEELAQSIEDLETAEKNASLMVNDFSKDYKSIVQNAVEEFRIKFVNPIQDALSITSNDVVKKQADYNKAVQNGYVCEGCNRPFDDIESMKAHVLNLEKELNDLRNNETKFREKYFIQKDRLKDLEAGNFEKAQVTKAAYEKKIKETDTIRKELKKARLEYEQALEIKRLYDVATSRSGSLKEAIDSLVQSQIDLRTQVQTIELKTFEFEDISAAKNKLVGLREAEKEGLKAQAELGQRIKDSIVTNERRLALLQSINESAKRQGLLEKLCLAFSRKGIPASIIETILPEIEEIANVYLSKMSENSLKIRFRTAETLKTGEVRDTLEIDVFDGMGWRTCETYSGGEKFRVSLSIRLALSRILANKSGVELSTIIFDEPGLSLDSNGREYLVSTIKSLNSFFSNIIIMTHLDLINEFSERISIEEVRNDTERFI